jgi:hypothetical protein
MDSKWQDFPDSSFGERDAAVLQVIGEEGLTIFTFDGLKRRLGLHPETLSRILCRLEDQGVIEKTVSGYRIASKANEFLRLHPLRMNKRAVPILQTVLPPNVPIQQIVSKLKGKWFGILRWLGSSENIEGTTMKWVTEDGGVQVDANFMDTGLTIEAKLLHGTDFNLALKASYQLIGYISRLYSTGISVQSVSFTESFPPYYMSSA